MPDTLGAMLDRIEETRQRHLDELEAINAKGDTYEFLVAVRRCPVVPLAMKVKVATELLPYERPKLGVTVNINDDGTFAARLDAAIERSRQAPKIIEHGPPQKVEPKSNGDYLPAVPDRRFRRA